MKNRNDDVEYFNGKQVIKHHAHFADYEICEKCIGISILVMLTIFLLGNTVLAQWTCYLAIIPGVVSFCTCIIAQVYQCRMQCCQCGRLTKRIVRKKSDRTLLFECEHCGVIIDSMITYSRYD